MMKKLFFLFLVSHQTKSSEIEGDHDDFIVEEEFEDSTDVNTTNISPPSVKCLVEKLPELDETKYLVNCANRNISDEQAIQMKYLNASSMINLSQNLLTEFPDLNSSNIQKLEELDVSYNKITFDHLEVKWRLRPLLSSLTRLDLSHNNIGNISVSLFKPLNDTDDVPLTELDLSFNELTFLPEFLFDSLENLESLDLSYNANLGELRSNTASALSSLKNLRTLRLRGCGLSIVPASLMSNLVNLRSLDLGDNSFHRVDPSLQYAVSLEQLNLDNNLIDILDHTSFEGMNGLKNVSISYNKVLSTIEKNTFEATPDLEDLRLSHNPGLYWLHPEAWPLTSLNTSLSWRLRRLDLSSCGLSYLPSMLPPSFNDWFSLASLQLGDNPWECDCHNTWLMERLIPDIHNKTPELLHDVVCAGPRGSRVAGEEMYVVSQLSASLPCDQASYDPYLRHQHPGHPDTGEVTGAQGTLAVVSIASVLAILGTAALVFSLYRQQRRARGRDLGYNSLARRFMDVATVMGTGRDNTEYQEDGAEMTEVREAAKQVQVWPPTPPPNFQ